RVDGGPSAGLKEFQFTGGVVHHEEGSASSEGHDAEPTKDAAKCDFHKKFEGFGPLVESCDIGSLNFSDFGDHDSTLWN
ncbi:hypothetical protein ACUWCL_29445, partial [Klebsiella pneumoniae]|uniref:hypothetical protein n=1 Tax=Klebsiella pneumoniae TaxID=573 RepID=UPI0040554561